MSCKVCRYVNNKKNYSNSLTAENNLYVYFAKAQWHWIVGAHRPHYLDLVNDLLWRTIDKLMNELKWVWDYVHFIVHLSTNWQKRNRKLHFHLDKPVSWLLTHQESLFYQSVLIYALLQCNEHYLLKTNTLALLYIYIYFNQYTDYLLKRSLTSVS